MVAAGPCAQAQGSGSSQAGMDTDQENMGAKGPGGHRVGEVTVRPQEGRQAG